MIHSAPNRLMPGIVLAMAMLLAACGKTGAPAATETTAASGDAIIAPALIPQPAAMMPAEGGFMVSADTPVHARGSEAETVARQFIALAAKTPQLQLKLDDAATDAGGIVFAIDDTLPAAAPEAYSLDVSPQRIRVSASDGRGLYYGAVTLWQLLTSGAGDAPLRVPALRIDDTPRFGWRGLMLDSARHFQSVDEIKRVLDQMALHKLNTFHWHLTDDQGWRIEIKQYPKLTEVGGCRVPAGDGGIDPKSGQPRPYCGFYTQEQIRDVVAHAAALHITIVPEIDMPGHAQAAIAAYPELGVLGDKPVPLNEWGVNTYLFNVEESTFRFLENVLDEVITLFPGKYIHLGGDEAVKDQWKASPRVQARMRELGIRTEEEMQSHLLKRLEKHLVAKDRLMIGWDEILAGGLPPEAAVMSWRGTEGGIAAAKQGHDVVMSPVSDLYLDYLQTDSPNEPPGRPATVTLQEVYAYEPMPAGLDATQQKHVLGVQANTWTEHMRGFERVQHAIFPRIAALAESAWSPAERKDWDGFLKRLPVQLQRYRALGIAYAQTPFQVDIATAGSGRDGKVQVALSNPLGYEVRYTTDGSAPAATSPLFEQPLDVKLPAQVQAAAFFAGQPLATASVRKLDATSLLTRNDEEMKMCTGNLMLRLEDDGPADGERAIFKVDIFNPCWQWTGADLDGIAAIEVRAGRIPYYFQLAHDEPHRKFKPAKSAHGELEIRSGCEGPSLASVPLPAGTEADGFVTLKAELPAATAGSHDLCVVFTGDTRPAMWALDRISLLPAAPRP
ncbi:hexosaminidase [Luteimonas cucumeris]|uniref:beta-N-acetylhexosaminidase n=2 Tax=Luteimonas cucumeris TaxID=985012 RepID=A0A562LED2_9GAMM|nr:hexosaminidase [Luteimonas cucumeris]